MHDHRAIKVMRLAIFAALILGGLLAAFAQSESEATKPGGPTPPFKDQNNEPLETLIKRANASWEKPDYETAIPLYEKILGRMENDFGQDHPFVAKILFRLGTMRIPMISDTCSNPYRTPFRGCRTVVGAKRRSEGFIKGCPTEVKILPRFLRSFGAPRRGDDSAVNPRASSRRLFGRAVSGGKGLSNTSSRCRRSLRVTDSPARPNRRAWV